MTKTSFPIWLLALAGLFGAINGHQILRADSPDLPRPHIDRQRRQALPCVDSSFNVVIVDVLVRQMSVSVSFSIKVLINLPSSVSSNDYLATCLNYVIINATIDNQTLNRYTIRTLVANDLVTIMDLPAMAPVVLDIGFAQTGPFTDEKFTDRHTTVTCFGVPGPVQLLSYSVADNGALRIQWAPPSVTNSKGISYYRVTGSDSYNSLYYYTESSANRTIVDKSLLKSSTTFMVYAVNDALFFSVEKYPFVTSCQPEQLIGAPASFRFFAIPQITTTTPSSSSQTSCHLGALIGSIVISLWFLKNAPFF